MKLFACILIAALGVALLASPVLAQQPEALTCQELFVAKCTQCHDAAKAGRITGTKEQVDAVVSRMRKRAYVQTLDLEARRLVWEQRKMKARHASAQQIQQATNEEIERFSERIKKICDDCSFKNSTEFVGSGLSDFGKDGGQAAYLSQRMKEIASLEAPDHDAEYIAKGLQKKRIEPIDRQEADAIANLLGSPCRAVVDKKCSGCHGPDRMLAAMKSGTSPAGAVQQMQKKGVTLSDHDTACIVEYLLSFYVPRLPKAVSVAP